MPPAEQSAPSPRTMVTVLYTSAVVTVVIAVVLGALVTPALYGVALLAIVDVALARAYAAGRLRLASDPPLARPEEGGVVEGDSTSADPSYNPYARND